MKTHTLLASVAAALITSATLATVSKNYTDLSHMPAAQIHGTKVTNLAPINVSPSADEQRAASMLTDVVTTPVPVFAQAGGLSNPVQFSLVGSQLAMPYYSFGNKFGRISKE
ncbi:hypothetical protein [Rhodanobacter sp. L36]|uniref:hypothetical protein n=1 Tax=Rhodanobacter sp. L36 TaxID=1747221 RepID=UPI00131B7BC3|nr:hypothetical protein [Rhodanobacter sp. L36]